MFPGQTLLQGIVQATVDEHFIGSQREPKLVKKLWAMAKASSISASCATHLLAKPMATASSPPITRPENIISLAANKPTRRGSRWLMPQVGDIPTCHGVTELGSIRCHQQIAGNGQFQRAGIAMPAPLR